MTQRINKLVEAIKEIECIEEISTLIKGAAIALDVDFKTLYREVQNAYHTQVGNASHTSEEAVYNCANVN